MMVKVVGVRFRRAGKIYYFDPGAHKPTYGEQVIVETAEGPELGEVAVRVKDVPEEDISLPLRQVLRLATHDDQAAVGAHKGEERDAFAYCREKIAEHGLQMKLVDAEFALDRQRLTFYFTAERRVDFRALVKDLAGRFRTRIELRQIGARDEAKLLDGVGVCGRTLCCSTWMTEFDPVSIRHAKMQDMSLNPSRISGLCGRLKCCLRYEEEVYEELRRALPKVGDHLSTNRGPAKVVEVKLLKERIVVQTHEGTRFEVSLDQLREAESQAAAMGRHSEENAAEPRVAPPEEKHEVGNAPRKRRTRYRGRRGRQQRDSTPGA